MDLDDLKLEGATLACLDLSTGGPVSGLTLRNCEFGELVVPDNLTVTRVTVTDSVIHRLSGCASMNGLPAWIQRVEVAEFDAYATSAQILDRDELPMPVRVAMTILRKLYLQRGHGRKENALYRGIGQVGQRWVGDVLAIMSTEGLAIRAKKGANEAVWHSVAGMTGRVVALLDAPRGSNDPLAVACRQMQA